MSSFQDLKTEIKMVSGPLPQTGHMLPLPATSANSNEIVKYVRQYIYHDTCEEYTPPKVKSRSRKVFLSYRAEDNWKKTLERRSDQKQCGFFARCDHPYRDCGNVQLNSTKLVIESLKRIGSGFRNKTEESPACAAAEQVVVEGYNSDGDKVSQDPSLTLSSKITAAKLETATNGMNLIKECLEKSENRRISVKAGQPLSSCMQRDQQEQKNLLQAQEKSNMSRDMLILDPMENSLAGISNEIHYEEYSDHSVKYHYKSNFMEKLNCLLTLFNILQNIRIRDLKTKVPFNVDTINQLRSGPLIEPSHGNRLSRRSMFLPSTPREVAEFKGNRLLPSLINEGTSHADVFTPSNIHAGRKRQFQQKFKNSPTGLYVPTPNKWDELTTSRLESRAENTTHEVEHSFRAVSRMSVNGKLMKRQFQQKFKNSPTGLYVPTPNKWDELATSRLESRAENTTHEVEHSFRAVSRMSVNGKLMKRKYPNSWQMKAPTDVLPPWQKITQDYRDHNEKELQNKCLQGVELKSKKHDNVLEKLKNAFEMTKHNNNRKLKEELTNRIDATRKQFNCLKLGHLGERDLKNMRNEVNEWRHDISLSMAKPPLWYEELVSEQKTSLLKDDEEVNGKLEQITKYLDIKPTISMQAKFCLLVLSLPAYELCTLVMLDAVKFLSCKILEMPEHHHKDWLHSRKFITKK